MEDIAPKLFDDLKKDYEKELKKRTKKYDDSIENKKSDYKVAHDYSLEVNEALKKSINLNLKGDDLPDGRLYFNIAERTIKPLLEISYNDVGEFCKETQKLINESNDIGIKAVKPQINQDRIDETISYLANADKFEEVKNDLFAMSENFLLSAVDESVRKNAEIQYNRGLSPKIKRISTGNCCKWCDKLSGIYDYADVKDTGNDVFRRHTRCKCFVVYSAEGDFKDSVDSHTKRKIDYKKVDEWYLKQHKKGDKVLITEQAINKVNRCGPKSFSEENMEYTKQCRRELLEFSKNGNNSNETSCLIDLTKNVKTDFVKGDNDSVNVEANTMCLHWLRTKEKNSLELTHNHPGLSYFSLNDINFFMSYNSVRTMSVVTNQGKVWYISKTDDFDFNKAKSSMNLTLEKTKNYGKNKNDKTVELFLKEGYTYGIERN